MLDIGFGEILILAAAALFIFGPDKLPKLAADAARTFRTLRQMVANARRDLTDSLGPEFDGINLDDLNPRTFVRKQLLDDLDADLDDGANEDAGEAVEPAHLEWIILKSEHRELRAFQRKPPRKRRSAHAAACRSAARGRSATVRRRRHLNAARPP